MERQELQGGISPATAAGGDVMKVHLNDNLIPVGGTESANSATMVDRPRRFFDVQPNGQPLKSVLQVMLDRRATPHFKDEAVPDAYLEAILRFGAQAPSGYNLQPWRFIVLRDQESRKRLQKVALNQSKIAEAPVVIIALGMKEGWRADVGTVFQEGVRRGVGDAETMDEEKAKAVAFLDKQAMDVWVTRHTMIAVTTMMLVAEAYGFQTAPMEGFDADGVKQEFGVPADAEVVALLGIGRAEGDEKEYPGRFPLERLFYKERFGGMWEHSPEAVPLN